MGVKPAVAVREENGLRVLEGGIWTGKGASDRGLEGTERLHCGKRDGLYCLGDQTDGQGMWHEWGRRVVHIWFWLGNVKA